MCDGTFMANGWRVMIETRRVQHRFEVAVDRALRTRGISYAQFRALELLLEEPDLHASELARRLRLSRQTVASTIEKLERVDLIAVDREHARMYVTPSSLARERVGRLRRNIEEYLQAIERELTPTGCGQLVALLRRADGSLAAPLTDPWWLDP